MNTAEIFIRANRTNHGDATRAPTRGAHYGGTGEGTQICDHRGPLHMDGGVCTELGWRAIHKGLPKAAERMDFERVIRNESGSEGAQGVHP